jgi:DNA repair exonuclease SbcCD ATPase subunit
LQQVNAQLQAINQDQDRIRKNIKDTPKEAPVFKTWLDKLSEQEKQIDTLTAKQKELQAAEQKAKAAYEKFLSGITVG